MTAVQPQQQHVTLLVSSYYGGHHLANKLVDSITHSKEVGVGPVTSRVYIYYCQERPAVCVGEEEDEEEKKSISEKRPGRRRALRSAWHSQASRARA